MIVTSWDLRSDTALKAAVAAVTSALRQGDKSWHAGQRTQLMRAQSSADTYLRRDFLEQLWEDDTVHSLPGALSFLAQKIGRAARLELVEPALSGHRRGLAPRR